MNSSPLTGPAADAAPPSPVSPLASSGRHPVRLERRDLLVFEQRLRDALARLLPFKGHSLHFPPETPSEEATYAAEDKKLLLPLFAPPEGNGPAVRRFLGLFAARGVPPKAARPLLPFLPACAELVMENLSLYKQSLCDPVTALFTRQHLLDAMAREIEGLRGAFRSPALLPGGPALDGEASQAPETPAGGGCFGVLAVRLPALRDVVREHGYLFADQLMAALGAALRELCPGQALAARAGDFELALLLPSSGGAACRRLAAEVAQKLSAVTVPHVFSRSGVGVAATVGYALYPQDMDGGLFGKPGLEQARVLLRKARLAAALAAEEGGPAPAVLGFGRILAEGGRILELLPLSRAMVSLGRNMNAREGQRFSVWAPPAPGPAPDPAPRGEAPSLSPPPPLYKGELVLMEVREHSALAEVIHVGDPTWQLERGDTLTLLPDDASGSVRQGGGAALRDPLTGLLRHGDFLARWCAERETCEQFSLALLRLAPNEFAPGSPGSEDEPSAHPERLMGEAVRLLREEFGQDITGGRYGLASLILFHPGMGPEEAQTRYSELAALLGSRLFPGREDGVAVGSACHPYLGFRKADALENCQKALEYALLLPAPHVGVLDTLALTISADKRFSLGDSFAALEEYKRALLADAENVLAWNSLGVCLAALGRHNEARRYFEETLARQPKDSMTLYNLGHTCQCLGDIPEAKDCYRRCLRAQPDHLYALLRLGQLAEQEKNHNKARKLYRKAATLPGGPPLVRRQLAGLALREGTTEEARELLHETLMHDPRNAVALHLLARLYLDGGEDAEVAESLARQSVALRPDLKGGWLELARALEARGRWQEAREALLTAGRL